MDRKKTITTLNRKYRSLRPIMDERVARVWAGTEARALGAGGITVVCEATGMSRTRVRQGIREAQGKVTPPKERIRRPGAGRPRVTEDDPDLLTRLEELVEPLSRGDPQSPLRWTTKSLRKLADTLCNEGHMVSYRTVGRLLKKLNYRLQANKKRLEGKQHPDRNEQFEYINAQVEAFQSEGQPVISVDTKKKELVGPFKNAGQMWLPAGEALPVNVHDFPDEESGKVIPYGVYDMTLNNGWVNIGVDHDTSAFAVASIRRWWQRMGRFAYPGAQQLLVTADAGGSNSHRAHLWKVELQKLADAIDLEIHVCHFPPGTSKWNKIEHRMFCHITENWRGQPLVDHETVVQLIGSTRTRKGLKVKAALDARRYPKGIKVPKQLLDQVLLTRDSFHGDWNYAITPTGWP